MGCYCVGEKCGFCEYISLGSLSLKRITLMYFTAGLFRCFSVVTHIVNP